MFRKGHGYQKTDTEQCDDGDSDGSSTANSIESPPDIFEERLSLVKSVHVFCVQFCNVVFGERFCRLCNLFMRHGIIFQKKKKIFFF